MLNMDDYTEETLRKVCCTCLSIDRKLQQLCKLDDGINNLFFLLSSDSEAYKAMFSRDASLLFICWECSAIMHRQRKFIEQVCTAQKQLSQIIGRQLLLKSTNSLSKLTSFHQNTYNIHFLHNDNIDNFIDCGPDINDIKCELESNINNESNSTDEFNTELTEEMKVSERSIEIKPLVTKIKEFNKDNLSKKGSVKRKAIHETDDPVKEEGYSKIKITDEEMVERVETNKEQRYVNATSIDGTNCESKSNINNESTNDSNDAYNNELLEEMKVYKYSIEIKPLVKKTRDLKKDNLSKKGVVRRKIKEKTDDAVKEEGYSKIKMTEEEMVERVEIKKLEEVYVNATSKCESCVRVFKDENELEEHNSKLHVQKPKLVKCDICLIYIRFRWFPEHRDGHYHKYQCHHCELVSYTLIEILTHLRVVHSMKDALPPGMIKKLKRRAMLINPVLAPKKQNDVRMDGESPLGFKCEECNKFFENRYLRYRHILRSHREGHKCPTCGKTFAFKHALIKHQLVHADAPPKQPCPACGKMLRADCLRVHARVHSDRHSVECVTCDKRFVSHDTYEKHLKYSRKHAVRDVRINKCTMCDKRYRTKRELNDHIDYSHIGKTQYECPICHKALATGPCVTRHVSRAHHGIKKLGEKLLCKTCGKAFTEKKSLREHELIHTGEKPLSCDECGRSFRQSACLYTHKRRVHKMAAKRARVRHASAPPGDKVKTETCE